MMKNFMKGMLFLLELCDLQRLYALGGYSEHEKMREIMGGENGVYEV